MSLIKCEKCGELYSDSYRGCPFCVEDEEYYNGNGKKKNRRPGGTKKRPGFLLSLLSLLLAVLVGGGIWYFYGDNIQAFFTRDKGTPSVEDGSTGGDTHQEEIVPVDLVMDETLRLAPNTSEKLTISGGTSYEWISSDPPVATVSGSGMVHAVKEGTTIITVTDSSGVSAVCLVTVTTEPEDTTEQTPSGSTLKPTKPTNSQTAPITVKEDLSKLRFTVPAYGTELYPTADGTYDISLMKSQGETSFQLTAEGISNKVVWNSANSNIVTVDSNGTFRAVGYGEAAVTAKIGNAEVKFLVRVK